MKNSAAALFLPLLEQTRAFCVETPNISGSQGNNKAGPAVTAAPEMWNILFIKG